MSYLQAFKTLVSNRQPVEMDVFLPKAEQAWTGQVIKMMNILHLPSIHRLC